MARRLPIVLFAMLVLPRLGGCGDAASIIPVRHSGMDTGALEITGEAAVQLTATDQEDQATAVPSLWNRRDGADWPRFLGPTFDGKSTETGIRTAWDDGGLPLVWTMPVGTSYGIGAVAAGRYFQHERVGDSERLRALHAETGQPLWQHALPVQYRDLYGYNDGPRDTPAVDGNQVFTFGVAGRLTCRDVRDGQPQWNVETNRRYGVIQNFFGVGSSPLVHQDKVIVMVGGSPPQDADLPPGRLDRVSPAGSALVALDRRTGEERWKVGEDLASYSCPRLMTIQGVTVVLLLARDGLLAVTADDGRQLWHYPHRSRMLESVNAAVPVVSGNQLLISECYEVGSVMLEVSLAGVQEVWKDPPNRRQQILRAHWATPILVDGWLYGCSGRNEPDSDLRCFRWSDREIGWIDPRRSRSSLMYVDGHFVVLDESGLLQLVRADAREMEVVSEIHLERPPAALTAVGYQPMGRPYWAAPILSHGLLYVRGSDAVACFELIPGSPPRQ